MAETLTPEEWALAIIIGFESGKGLTEEGLKELRDEIRQDKVARSRIREILIEQGYGPKLGLA